MSESRLQESIKDQPVCTVEPMYWRDGLRWKIVLQVMYLTSGTERAAGQGPFFFVGHAWTEAAARAKTLEIKGRLERSWLEVSRWLDAHPREQ